MLIDMVHSSNHLTISKFFYAEHRTANNFVDYKLHNYRMNIRKFTIYEFEFQRQFYLIRK